MTINPVRIFLLLALLFLAGGKVQAQIFSDGESRLHPDSISLEPSLRTYEYSQYGALVASEFLTFWETVGMQHSSCYISLPEYLEDVPAQLRDFASEAGLRLRSKYYFECDLIELAPDHPMAAGRKRTLTPYGWVAVSASPPLLQDGVELKNEFELFVDVHTWRGDMGVKTHTQRYIGRFAENYPEVWKFTDLSGAQYSGTPYYFTTFD